MGVHYISLKFCSMTTSQCENLREELEQEKRKERPVNNPEVSETFMCSQALIDLV